METRIYCYHRSGICDFSQILSFSVAAVNLVRNSVCRAEEREACMMSNEELLLKIGDLLDVKLEERRTGRSAEPVLFLSL